MIASDHEQDHKPQTFNDHMMKTSSFSVNHWLDYIVRLFYIGKHSVRIFVIPLLSIMIGLLAWQGLTQTHADIILDFSNIPSPLHVYKSFLNVVVTKTYWKDIYWSLYRIALAFTIGSLVGVTVGVALGYSAILRLIIAPYIEIMRPIPAIAWVPMSILMWPTTEQSIVFITFLGAVFPIVLNTWDGVKRVPIELVKAARSLGANRISVLFHVVIPYAIPNITVGMALGMGAAWFALLAGEMISGRYGIGYFTWESYELIQYGNIIVGMLTIGILSSITSGAIYLIKRKIVPWSE
ncbi:MAG: ABC transporter permease [Acidithiobacillus ferriphilus]|uniref:ABC transporter permease n=1 Tax=Acidithiobacillus ferriphilus TaxID=1689834 RepID=UPI001C078974|nr:ABC transporter permease [Acidithiobacillus ferriphilus]MBU2828869.1 ABC transporter permease [Acidithiobacillus ferriphilus]MBU2845627.1 ABC transporter permease [Acidithiobacillus ferriphilus]MEB8476052.1 ABC transporter permease [Acidithiobacillus ferriphilus]UEP59910.1 ABC transporter permease [Acidithiobacillus ferriphilus]